MFMFVILIFQLTGTLDWVQTAYEDMKVSCDNEVRRNFSLWVVPPGETQPVPPPEITDKLCPLDCSGHGQCVKGKNIVGSHTFFGRQKRIQHNISASESSGHMCSFGHENRDTLQNRAYVLCKYLVTTFVLFRPMFDIWEAINSNINIKVQGQTYVTLCSGHCFQQYLRDIVPIYTLTHLTMAWSNFHV